MAPERKDRLQEYLNTDMLDENTGFAISTEFALNASVTASSQLMILEILEIKRVRGVLLKFCIFRSNCLSVLGLRRNLNSSGFCVALPTTGK